MVLDKICELYMKCVTLWIHYSPFCLQKMLPRSMDLTDKPFHLKQKTFYLGFSGWAVEYSVYLLDCKCLTNSSASPFTFSLSWDYTCAGFCSWTHGLQLNFLMRLILMHFPPPFFWLQKLPFTSEGNKGWRCSIAHVPNTQMQFAFVVVGRNVW